MSFPVSICFPPPATVRPLTTAHAFKPFRERPRGLWKARVTSGRISTPNVPDRKEKPLHPISDTDDDDERCDSPPPCKKQRTDDSSDDDSSSFDDQEDAIFLHYTPHIRNWNSSSVRKMDTSSTACASTSLNEKKTCDMDDWEDLKDLFAKATEQYEGNDAAEGLPLLRGVIHECHRFLHVYPDPSVLFAVPTPPESSRTGRKSRQGSSEPSSAATLHDEPLLEQKSLVIKFELPTAFHALLGTALFLFGNLIAQEPSLALEGEPTNPVPYWLAALDVFETGENLPSRTTGTGYTDCPEDWRMAIIWGRTLVCLADDLVNRQIQARQDGEENPHEIYLDVEEPEWPRESPFHAIAAQRQPITRRMSFTAATPNDLLVLAMDQFSRGIFHMPHAKHIQSWPILGSPAATSGLSSASEGSTFFALPAAVDEQFSRARELYTIASEVLTVAEKLETPSERHYWANWADSVLNQMKMESERDAWRTPVLRSRGRCRLIAGSAFVEAIETALERGETDVLRSEEATDAREDLSMAIDFFERAKLKEGDEHHARGSSEGSSDSPELRLLLAESLVTLANLTKDRERREALYARAKAEAGSNMDLDLDLDLGADDDDDDDENDRMDESH